MVALNHNTEEHKPSAGFDPLPQGNYKVAITASEIKVTKSGKGTQLVCDLQVLDGEHKGRLLWARFNMTNPNPQAVEIGKGELSSMMLAMGIASTNDSTELHNRPFVVKVIVKKRSDTGELGNEIKGYESLASASQTPVAAGAGSAPWSN